MTFYLSRDMPILTTNRAFRELLLLGQEAGSLLLQQFQNRLLILQDQIECFLIFKNMLLILDDIHLIGLDHLLVLNDRSLVAFDLSLVALDLFLVIDYQSIFLRSGHFCLVLN